MPELDRLLAENLTAAFVFVTAVLTLLIVALLIQGARLRKAVGAYRDLVRDERGGQSGSLHELLAAHADQIAKAGARMTEMEELHEILIRRSERAIQHVGVVRFNPFDDTGSDQSFVVALLDSKRDGIVLSSLHGRQSTRVFTKPIVGGTSSTHQLSEEETDAIRIALQAPGE